MFSKSYFIECDDRIIEVIDYDSEDNGEAVLSLAKEIGKRNGCLSYGIDFLRIHCTFKWRSDFLQELPLCYRVKEYIFSSSMLKEILVNGEIPCSVNMEQFFFCKEVERVGDNEFPF